MKFERHDIENKLRESLCEVVFTKTDGTERVMKCTLKPDVLKPYIDEIERRNAQLLQEGKEIKPTPIKSNVISVIDVEKNGWRSFRIDSIKSIVSL